MDILKIKNEDGTWTSIPAIIGPKGDKGDKGEPGTSVDVPIATTAVAGKVKPDGTTITITEDGTISSAGGGGSGWDLSDRIAAGTGKCAVVLGSVETSPYNSEATGSYSLAVGSNSKATTEGAIALAGGKANGYLSIAHADSVTSEPSRACVALGYNNKAQGDSSIALGSRNDVASGDIYTGIAIGVSNNSQTEESGFLFGANNKNTLNTDRTYAFGGYNEIGGTSAKIYDSLAIGNALKVKSSMQTAVGNKNIEDTAETYALIFGNGVDSPSNALTLDWQGNGAFQGQVTSQGADYAEYFEWIDGNPEAEDRVGYLVTLDGNKIRKANAGDDILGIISGTVGVLGDNYEWNWNGKYLTDDFGRIIYDMVEEFADEEKKESVGFFPHPRINPAYNPDEKYVNRANRKEWDAVGMMGKLFVRDDGTANIGDYVAPGVDGIATKTNGKTNMRVMERVKPNIIRVVLK